MTLKAWIPPPRVPIIDDEGHMTRPWYMFFEYIANQRLGGPNGRDNALIAEAVNAANLNGTRTKTALDAAAISNTIATYPPI